MIVARIFNGLFNGLLTSTVSGNLLSWSGNFSWNLQVPTYQSECAKPHRRGQLLLLSGSLITFVSFSSFCWIHKLMDQGIMCAYWINLGFYYVAGQASWRVPIALQSIFTFAMWVKIHLHPSQYFPIFCSMHLTPSYFRNVLLGHVADITQANYVLDLPPPRIATMARR